MIKCLKSQRWRAFAVGAFCVLGPGQAQSAVAGESVLPLVPYPQTVMLRSGSFQLQSKQSTVQAAVSDTAAISVALADLNEIFGSKGRGAPGKPVIVLGIPAEDRQFEQRCRQKKIWPQDRIGDEGYVLLVEKREITLAANSAAGLFYGVQTLRQLVANRDHTDRIPCLKVVDWPQYRHRGMQDDISRGPVPTLDYMKMQIRRCAELKLNMVSYYVEHVVATARQPYFAPAGGAVSITEWQMLSDYARHYFVELVPNFQSFGHFEKVLANPHYQKLGESGRLLSPAFEESYELLQDVYSEMAPAFHSQFFNVNCDETWDLGRGGSKKLVDSLGVAEVYLRHLLRLSEMVTALGKRMMMWGDVLAKHPEIVGRIPAETVIMGWDYSAHDDFDFLLKPLLEAGHDFFVVPGVLNSNRIMPDYRMTRANIRNLAQAGAGVGAIGLLNTVWDDGGFALFSRDWLGVAYGAEKSWNVGPGQESSFDRRFDRVVYGDRTGHVSQAIMALTELTELAATQEMNEAVAWQRVIPERGGRVSVNLAEWDRVQAICNSAAALLALAQPQRQQDELEVWRFTLEQYRYMTSFRKNMVDAAEHYRRAVLSQRSQPAAARRRLVAALKQVADVVLSTQRLREIYSQLWLAENKTYWLDRNLARYDDRLVDLRQTRALLLSALADFDKGQILPPPDDRRLAISEATGQYFQYWLLAGPFPNLDRKSYAIDYLTALGGEAKARGRVAGEFTAPDGRTYRWRKFSFPEFGKCDLAKVFENNELVIAYAYARIESPVAQTVRATFGSNDGIKLFLNGNLEFEHHIARNLTPDEEQVMLPLVKGMNHLLLKIDQGKGGWAFSFRLPDNIVRNHKHKYRILP